MGASSGHTRFREGRGRMTDRTRGDDMRKCARGLVAIVAVAISTISLTAPRAALAAAAAGVDEDANAALKKLYASEPAAKLLSEKAKAILVFPTIVKAGFMRSEEHTSELQSQSNLVCRLLLEKKKSEN